MKRIKCEHCNKLLKLQNFEEGYEYSCPKCKSIVYRVGESPILIVSLAISSLLVFILAISLPLLNVHITYDTQISILDSIRLLFKNDILSSALLSITIVIIPLFMLCLTLLIIFNKALNLKRNTLKNFISTYIHIKEWNMISIYFIGLLISMVKIKDISEMSLLPGFWINALFIFLLYLTITWFNPYDTLHIHSNKKRKENSILKTSIYLILAIIFILPANLLPIMPIYQLSIYFPSTLWDGVVAFWNDGDILIAIIIFTSSIFLPIAKIVGITFMIIMVKYDTFSSNKIFATKFYNFMSKIGKFSMIDVYVVVFASSFIQYDDLLRIDVGSAFIPFTCVVLFTVLAYKNFDTKLIWKNK